MNDISLQARSFIMFLPGCVHSSYVHMFSYVSIYHNTHFWTRYPNIGTSQNSNLMDYARCQEGACMSGLGLFLDNTWPWTPYLNNFYGNLTDQQFVLPDTGGLVESLCF